MLPNNCGVVMLVHGTRNVQAGEVIHAALQDLCVRFAQQNNLPAESVHYAFLEAMVPLLANALRRLCEGGITDIRIVPLLLFPGSHLYTDIPEIAKMMMEHYPAVKIHIGEHLGVEDPGMMDVILKRASFIHSMV